MFSFLSRNKSKNPEVFEDVVEGLKTIYQQKLLPLEQAYNFHEFHSPTLANADFEAKPMILLIGQYSTGKTTFIKYLLERDFPGIRIGPEPTTDSFVVVKYDEREGVIPGNALVVDSKNQFKSLVKFGNNFLSKFQCSQVNSSVLKHITIIDTPGILAGDKQRIDRGYDFAGVIEWFAERADRIIILFDAHKLDISDELRRSIEALRRHDDKIHIVLNKADMIDHQQLMRVYGALMWSLGKILQTPEVAHVYVGSFWDQPFRYDLNRKLFEDEEQDLFRDLQTLPKNAIVRKLNDVIKRARLAKVHALIIGALKNKMPSTFGKNNKKKDLLKNLDFIYASLQREHRISPGDFPDVKKMQELLIEQDFSKFNRLNPKLIDMVDRMLSEDIGRLIPIDDLTANSVNKDVHGGAFESNEDMITPFSHRRSEYSLEESEWCVAKEKYDQIFNKLAPNNGKISGSVAKMQMMKSKLPNSVLGKVWKLSDIDQDGYLDSDEFAVAMHLISKKLEGHELPNELPPSLLPPARRKQWNSTTSSSTGTIGYKRNEAGNYLTEQQKSLNKELENKFRAQVRNGPQLQFNSHHLKKEFFKEPSQ